VSNRYYKGIKELFAKSGITGRWLLNFFSILVFAVIIIEFSLFAFIRSYYYNSIEQSILQRSQVTAGYFQSYAGSSEDFKSAAQSFVDDYEYKDNLELQVIDPNGSVSASSAERYPPSQAPYMRDYSEAIKSENGIGVWRGKNESGEQVMCITKLIYSQSGENSGAVRFLVSLEPTDRSIFILMSVVMLLGVSIIFFTLVTSTYFISTILEPVTDIGLTARRIAEGDFKARLSKKHEDELGNLCDTINDMAEELALSEKVKNEFISSVSHELRTPLTAIKGWCETISDTTNIDRGTFSKGIKVIGRESERLASLVEDLLDFSRMQDGRFSLSLERMDVLAELGEAVYMFTERVKKEEKLLVYNEPEFLPPILGDMNRLKQVFVNIIDNAIKYTDAGDVINITAAQVENDIRIDVSDTGCGIAEEDLPNIKAKFYKANLTRRGFGIGLAVADEIINMHSGTLDLQSKLNIGTTVTIILPAITKRLEDERGYTGKLERSLSPYGNR
jgi:signal transduction histidine kinase